MLGSARDKHSLVPQRRELKATDKGVYDHKNRSHKYHMEGS